MWSGSMKLGLNLGAPWLFYRNTALLGIIRVETTVEMVKLSNLGLTEPQGAQIRRLGRVRK